MLTVKRADIPLGVSIAGAIFCKALSVLHIWDFAFIPGFLFEIIAGLLYSIRIFSNENISKWSYAKFMFIIIWTLCGLAWVFEYGNIIFSIIRTFSFWGWIIILGVETFYESKSGESMKAKIKNVIFLVGSVCIILGVAFKILHLDGGNILLYIGIALGVYWIFNELVKKEQD